MGHYINADDILSRLLGRGFFHLHDFGLQATQEDWERFLAGSSLFIQKIENRARIDSVKIERNVVVCQEQAIDSYLTALVAEFLRSALLQSRQSMSFESVMSHPSKVAFLKSAKDAGYRTYVYFVATNNVRINLSRVQARAVKKGHDVPKDKIRQRYARSIALLPEAIHHADRAYIFDNSSTHMKLIAEVTDGSQLALKTEDAPDWISNTVLPAFT